MTIPEAAVEAAWASVWDVPGRPASDITSNEMRAALEAAAPHMRAAWEDARKGHALGPARAITWPDGTVLPARLQGQDNATGVRAMIERLKKGATK